MNNLRIVKGNTFATLIRVKAFRYDGTEIIDFKLEDCENIRVFAHTNDQKIEVDSKNIEQRSNNMLKILWDDVKLGEYCIEVCGKYYNNKWRFYDKTPIFTIVNTNSEGNIPHCSVLCKNCYRIFNTYVRLYDATRDNMIDYIGEDLYVYKWNGELKCYERSNIYVGSTADTRAIERKLNTVEQYLYNDVYNKTATNLQIQNCHDQVIDEINDKNYITINDLEGALPEIYYDNENLVIINHFN